MTRQIFSGPWQHVNRDLAFGDIVDPRDVPEGYGECPACHKYVDAEDINKFCESCLSDVCKNCAERCTMCGEIVCISCWDAHGKCKFCQEKDDG